VDSAHVLLLPWLAGLATVGLLVLVVASRSARSGPRASRWLSRVVGAAAIGQLVWLWSWGAL
jgi:threonine/homoserine/homoserine lactone efflux protein